MNQKASQNYSSGICAKKKKKKINAAELDTFTA